eukprot:CAMPEP_0183303238 /NCGR_PEP_ID=MMETSP0160_2-20130417/8755_1 /TAXON_ID=2839 ORGANISM="Odontella Sinensis, Strain Grunow 1884" /NCGR_SAMPLE_ID=MMETSP0160_2 /ASSEMBLY_ACC=CAM_ASM_000250 /LENGTH=62 /DNA_ID=CAMNT_0025466121 /DNA_START=370 /DNA_END=555 /DNA_ORIENTATION=+
MTVVALRRCGRGAESRRGDRQTWLWFPLARNTHDLNHAHDLEHILPMEDRALLGVAEGGGPG